MLGGHGGHGASKEGTGLSKSDRGYEVQEKENKSGVKGNLILLLFLVFSAFRGRFRSTVLSAALLVHLLE